MKSAFARIVGAFLVCLQAVVGVPASAIESIHASDSQDAGALRGFGLGGAESHPVVDGFSGEATTRIPLVVPPGTGGLTPKVAFSYRSRRSNGPLGVGWSLDVGPAVIERSTRFGAPNYDSSDVLELGGARLRRTAVANEYVTENNDFSRIEYNPAGNYWLVLSPDGTRRYYGYHYDAGSTSPNLSRLDSTEVLSTQNACPTSVTCSDQTEIVAAGIPFAWYLDRVEDRNGNVILLRWTDASSGSVAGDAGMRYLAAISYSEHVAGGAGQVPAFGEADDGSLSQQRLITFDYETRPDVFPTFRTGFRREIGHRLSGVRVTVDGALVRHYVLSYEQSPASGRSRLIQIQERGTTDDPTTAFVYSLTYENGVSAGWSAKISAFALPANLTFLVNGRDAGVRIVDVNGDGYPDVVYGNSGIRATYLGGPSGFDSQPTAAWAPPDDFVTALGFTGLVFGDFDGDGRLDLLRRTLLDQGTSQASPPNSPCQPGQSTELENGSVDGGAWRNTGSGWAASPADSLVGVPIANELDSTMSYDYVGSSGGVPIGWAFGHCPVEQIPTAAQFVHDNVPKVFGVSTTIVDINGDGIDDIVYKRREVAGFWGLYGRSYLFPTQQFDRGTLLNLGTGLANGQLNNWHFMQQTEEIPTFGAIGQGVFVKDYSRGRWQLPVTLATDPMNQTIADWSDVSYCLDPSTGNNVVGGINNGASRIVDVNGDGLPDILESATNNDDPSNPVTARAASLNNGYTWTPVSGAIDVAAEPPGVFFSSSADQFSLDSTGCSLTQLGGGQDNGWRVVDVNGDGMPDWVGGPNNEVRLWDATRPAGSLWRANDPGSGWSLPAGVSFTAANGQDAGVRLADVNNDGMVDILVSDGAYLNLGEPPDMLASVRTPLGATTSFEYAPSSSFETPPRSNPTTADGQRLMSRAVWVVARVTTDPGTAFGQPQMVRDFRYFGPVFDIGDRAFRGFTEWWDIGPAVNGQRRVTVRKFHVSDALKGRLASLEVSRAPAGNPASQTVLVKVLHEYASASGATASSPMVTFSDETTQLLSDELTQQSAFAPFATLMQGSPDAAVAYLALEVGETVELAEGQPVNQAPQNRTEWSRDIYGNVIQERDLYDLANPNDDVTTTIEYTVVDGTSGAGPLLLADLPELITVSGLRGGIPPGPTLTRTTRILYDNQPLGVATRGNATAVERAWDPDGDGTPDWVRVTRTYDAYGNTVGVTSAFDPMASQSIGLTTWTYDTSSQTFPVSMKREDVADPSAALTTAFAYGIAGCGAPPCMGLVCSVTDPNNQSTIRVYDSFGRLVKKAGPNGSELDIDYHDSDRGTVNQRTEFSAAWDPADPSALTSRSVFFDGLGRTLRRTRDGRGSDVGSMTVAYDATGNVASTTRWAYNGTTGPATSFTYDVLGRMLTRTRPDGTRLTRTYSPRVVEQEEFDGGGALVHHRKDVADGAGRLSLELEYPDPEQSPTVTIYSYTPFGELASVRDAVSNNVGLCDGGSICQNQQHVTEIFYDDLGNRVELDDPDSGTWILQRNARGEVIHDVDPRMVSHDRTYDGLGRIQRIHTDNPPAGAEPDVVFSYGTPSTSVANGVGRLIRVDDSEGYEEFSYDAAGNVSTHERVIAGRIFLFDHTYDPLGRKIQTVFPDGETVTWHYDKRLLARISTTGGAYQGGDYVADAQYDARDQLLRLDLGGSAGSPVATETRNYDPATGFIRQLNAEGGGQTVANLQYTVDGVGRIRALVADTMPAGGSTLEERDFPTFAYDGLDRLIEAQGAFGADATVSHDLTYTYDALGNLRSKDGETGSGWTTLVYGDPHRPHALTAAKDSNGVVQRQYQYDAAGNVTNRLVDTAGTMVSDPLSYDSFGRLVAVGSPGLAMGYDAFGHRVRLTEGTTVLLYPEPGFEYVDDGTTRRVNKDFFVAGERVASTATSWVAPAADAPGLLGWRGPDVPAPPGWALGLLWGIAGIGLLGVGLRARTSRWRPTFRVVSAGVLGVVVPVLVASQCPDVSGPLGTHGDAVIFYVADPLNSTVMVLRADGSVRNRYLYRPFGDSVTSEGAGLHFRFAGGQLDPSGFYAFGARYYDPELGHFLQPDPGAGSLADPQSFNRYSYAFNDPVNASDPTGLFPDGGGSYDEPSITITAYVASHPLVGGVGGEGTSATGFSGTLGAMAAGIANLARMFGVSDLSVFFSGDLAGTDLGGVQLAPAGPTSVPESGPPASSSNATQMPPQSQQEADRSRIGRSETGSAGQGTTATTTKNNATPESGVSRSEQYDLNRQITDINRQIGPSLIIFGRVEEHADKYLVPAFIGTTGLTIVGVGIFALATTTAPLSIPAILIIGGALGGIGTFITGVGLDLGASNLNAALGTSLPTTGVFDERRPRAPQ